MNALATWIKALTSQYGKLSRRGSWSLRLMSNLIATELIRKQKSQVWSARKSRAIRETIIANSENDNMTNQNHHLKTLSRRTYPTIAIRNIHDQEENYQLANVQWKALEWTIRSISWIPAPMTSEQTNVFGELFPNLAAWRKTVKRKARYFYWILIICIWFCDLA